MANKEIVEDQIVNPDEREGKGKREKSKYIKPRLATLHSKLSAMI